MRGFPIKDLINPIIMIVDTMSLQEVGETILKTSRKSFFKIFELIARKERNYRKIIIKGLKDRYDFQPLSFTNDGI